MDTCACTLAVNKMLLYIPTVYLGGYLLYSGSGEGIHYHGRGSLTCSRCERNTLGKGLPQNPKPLVAQLWVRV